MSELRGSVGERWTAAISFRQRICYACGHHIPASEVHYRLTGERDRRHARCHKRRVAALKRRARLKEIGESLGAGTRWMETIDALLVVSQEQTVIEILKAIADDVYQGGRTSMTQEDWENVQMELEDLKEAANR